MHSWLSDVFRVGKPIIAMLHLAALPGDPSYDAGGGVAAITSRALRDLDALQSGGVDGVLISNEFSLPYLTNTEPITAISMARIIGELLPEISVPFGVNVLWDGRASIDLAVATGARFVREIFTGVYASDFGLWNTNIGETARHRSRLGAPDVKLLFNIVPESAAYLAIRDVESVARSTAFTARPDAFCVSGLTAGSPTDTNTLARVKRAVGDRVPVLVNTGVQPDNAPEQLSIADGAVVGTYFKEDGVFENRVVQSRVEELMAVVAPLREKIELDPMGHQNLS